MPTIKVDDFEISYKEAIAFDCETTGLSVYSGARTFATVLYSDTGECRVLWEDPENYDNLMRGGRGSERNERILRAVLGSPDVLKVGWNIGFDWRMIQATYNVTPVWPWADAQTAMSLLDERAFPFRLKQCSAAYLRRNNKPMFEDNGEEQVKLWLANNRTRFIAEYGREPNYADVPRAIMDKYIQADGQQTIYMWYLLKGGLERDDMMDVFNTEMHLVPVLVDLTDNGLYVDVEYLERHIKLAQGKIAWQNQKIREEVRYVPNAKSPKQMAQFMYQDLGLVCVDFTSSGAPSTSKHALKRHGQHPMIRRVRRIRKLEAFIKISKQILESIQPDGLSHPSFNQTGARTGRMSASAPPCQQFLREGSVEGFSVRTAFVNKPGFDSFHVDYKQVEMVDFADYSQDPIMMDMFRRGVDAHLGTANRLKHVMGDSREPTKHDRQAAKTLNFAIIYGAGDKTTMETINQDDELPELITMGATKALRRAYLEGFVGVNRLRERVAHEIATHGRVVDRFGRVHRLGSSEWYKAINWLIQGGCGVLMKRALVRGYHCLNWWNNFYKEHVAEQYITVHDEVGIRISKKLTPVQQQAILNTYCGAFLADRDLFDVPLKCDVEKFEPDWGHLVDWVVEPVWQHPSVEAGAPFVSNAAGVTQWWRSTPTLLG